MQCNKQTLRVKFKSSDQWKHLRNPRSCPDTQHCHGPAELSCAYPPPTSHNSYFLVSQISSAFSRTSNNGNHTVSTLYASFSIMLLRFICVIAYINNLSLFSAKGNSIVWIYCSSSILLWWAFGLFPMGACGKQNSKMALQDLPTPPCTHPS